MMLYLILCHESCGVKHLKYFLKYKIDVENPDKK